MEQITDIRPYLKYFIGCEVEVDQSEYNGPKHIWKLIGISIYEKFTFYEVIRDGNKQSFSNTPIKPILRRIDSLTEEEKFAVYSIQAPSPSFERSALETHYLISIGIWPFDQSVFDNGLIIEKK